MQRHTISFRNALNGIWVATSTQVNIRIHLLIGSIVLIAAVYFNLSLNDIILLLIVSSIVIATELVNTAIEFACDAITTDHNPLIKNAKDISAGAVLIVSIFAIIIGMIIFIPAII